MVDYAGFEDYIDMEYHGEIIGILHSHISGSYLTVACSDGKIRDIHHSKVTIIPDTV